MNEVWKDIKGFEGLYQVSNLGRIRSLDRWVNNAYNGGYWKPGRIRRAGATRGGYLFAPLAVDGKTTAKRVNRLVAEAFLDGYSDEIEVHHKDGDKTNNRADNLVCLSSEAHHEEHPPKAVIGCKGENVIRLRSSEEARVYGFDPANVSRCCKCSTLPDGHPKKKKYATHKGYKWTYA